MIINNKHVQGLYIYNSDSEFTKGDLVVSGECIYVCDANVISGIDPSEDTSYEYYRPYPGSKIISASEYFQYIKSGGTIPDKYVSSQAIMGILQGYQFGLNMEGIITDWIDQNGDTSLILSHITDRPIDNLILTETLNRGMIKIDWRLSQIIDGTVDGIDFSTLFGFLDKTDPDTGTPIDYQLMLSQYTYKQSANMYIRIQELMSPLSGVSVYRYMSWNDGEFPSDGSTISSWRNVFSYSTAIQSKLDALNKYYLTIADQKAAEIASLRGSFRFKEVYSGEGTQVNDLGEGIYTVCVEGTTNDGVTYSESMTVQLKSGMTRHSINFIKIPEVVVVSFNNTLELGGSIEVSGGKILSIYSREVRS